MATRKPSETEDQSTEEEPAEEEPAGDDADQDEESPAESSLKSTGSNRSALGLKVSDGSGVVLGLLVWGWFIVPYLKGGKGGVKAVLMAKFFNKAADGSPLA